MTDLQVFNYESQEVRTVLKNNEVWFVAKDVCGVLGLTRTNDALERIDDDEKVMRKISAPHDIDRHMWLVNESGLYSLILRSNKPEAKKFKKWVTSDVLPSIRKTGSYSIAKKLPTHQEALRGWADEIDKTEKLQIENQAQKQKILEDKPKVNFFNTVSSSEDTISMSECAKVLDMKIYGRNFGRNKLFEFLREKKIFQKDNCPYQSYIDRGYFKVIERDYLKSGNSAHIGLVVRVYQKGVDFVRKLLLEKPGTPQQLFFISK